MKKLLLLLACFMAFHLNTNAQTEDGSFMHDGILREYLVHLPENYTPGDQLPLVFNLHGITSNAFQQYLYSGFHLVADTADFIVCYPEGTEIPGGVGRQWNVSFPLSTNTADDVGFINELIDTMHAHYNINLDKVYSTGMSNGGYMSYKLACELTDRIQAIASVTGSMVPDEAENCVPSKTIPIMQVHGTSDPTVSYDGNTFGIGIEDLVTQWVEHNECALTPDTLQFDDSDPDDGCTVERIAYTDCDGNRKVYLYKVDGGGHTWPGASIVIGVTNQDINASAEIWNFFNQYGTDIPTSNHELSNDSHVLKVAPNPFTDYIHLEVANALIEQLVISNSQGQVVQQIAVQSATSFNISISDLNAGLYVISARTNKGTFSKKIIKH